ncbi:MAG: bifunctional hydroxymethylpyrimidine kinase/phosphomethylpyrimidine kinase, partial [Alphaproteobacteria bacterium]|nr:bifunctional hydroxymethylpyrimidine kinase/phosphomethylpyrimidine kinase [Alphaproteobacteria bacterium]
MQGRVLIIAGSDSGGGAGIQADIKTVTALGGYAATAITALTAQNTNGVHGVYEVPPAFVTQQIEVVLDDIGADAIKTGMLHSTDILDAVVAALVRAAPDVPLVVDPVMVAKGGASLLNADTRTVLRQGLIPRATVLTPNVPEAEILAEMTIADE